MAKTQQFDLNLSYLPVKVKLALIWGVIESFFGQEIHIAFMGEPIGEERSTGDADEGTS
jgi:hypothetical protein